MKQTPAEQRIAARMAPGVLTRDGFLGTDRRSLAEILDADDAEVRRLGVTHELLAGNLHQAADVAAAGLGTPVPVAEHLTAVSAGAMGRLPCPWGDGRLLAKGEVEMTDTRTGHTVRFTPLTVHLIAAHGFYQGRGSRYRLEPADLCRMFGLPGRGRD